MATIFRAQRNPNASSGGKILRGRRVAAITSPYARPSSPPPPPPQPENPNWLFGFIAPATRIIASGAGKLVSVFGSGISSSSSESDTDSEEDGSDDDNSSQETDRLNQNGTTSEAHKYLEKELQPIIQKGEAKLAIEWLLMQETFSRDECNKLTKIIQSRVIECPATKEGEDARQKELSDRAIGNSFAFPGNLQSDWQTRKSQAAYPYLSNGFDSLSPRASALRGYSPDFRNSAVMEAKKWLEERKLNSFSQLDQTQGTFISNSCMLPNVTEGEVGSPVDVAKSYMQARPPWASPSSSHIGFQTPSPIGMDLFKDETPYSVGGHSLPSPKILKRSSLAVGSWNNTLDESRSVHFKSREAILQTLSSSHIASSTLELEHKGSQTVSAAEKGNLEMGGVTHDSNSLQVTRSVDESAHVPTDLTINGGIAVHGGSRNGALSSVPATLVLDQNQDSEDAQLTMREGCTTFISHEPLIQDSASVQHNDSSSLEANLPTKKEVNGSIERCAAANGFPLSASRLSAGLNAELGLEPPTHDGGPTPINATDGKLTLGIPVVETSADKLVTGPRPENEGESNPASTSDRKLATSSIRVEETCELLSEASVEVPIIENSSGSQNSSSRLKKEISLTEQPEPISMHGITRRSNTRVENQQGKKVGRYTRRGRGRGK